MSADEIMKRMDDEYRNRVFVSLAEMKIGHSRSLNARLIKRHGPDYYDVDGKFGSVSYVAGFIFDNPVWA